MGELQDTVGAKVLEAMMVHDYLQLFFENQTILTIFNLFHVLDSEGRVQDTSFLKDGILNQVSESSQQVMMSFSTGVTLCIDLREQAYEGPEAMTLKRPGHPLMVWRSD